MYDQLARALGLREAEVAVFTALVGRGGQPATRIAKLCGRSRNTVRGILDKLVHDGYVVRSRRANSHLYAIESVQGITKVLRTKFQILQNDCVERLKVVQKYAKAIELRESSVRPSITFYDGPDGLIKVYEDTLSSGETIRSWGSFDANQDAIPSYFSSYYKRRAKKGIRIRSIHPNTPLTRKRIKKDRSELRDSVLVDPKRFNIQPEIQIYDHKVNIVSWKDELGIIIESKEIAHAMKQIFDLCFSNNRPQTRTRS